MRMSERRNIVSVSWSDHLIFGEGDGKLATIEALTNPYTGNILSGMQLTFGPKTLIYSNGGIFLENT